MSTKLNLEEIRILKRLAYDDANTIWFKMLALERDFLSKENQIMVLRNALGEVIDETGTEEEKAEQEKTELKWITDLL
jgi:hypothetical protein